jgi:hypothetical protein
MSAIENMLHVLRMPVEEAPASILSEAAFTIFLVSVIGLSLLAIVWIHRL